MATSLQAWIAVVASLVTALVGLFRYFNYRSRRDLKAAIGASSSSTVESLASDNPTQQMAAAVLLRRFFDIHTEQGSAGAPYEKEALAVITGMLREEQPERLRKVLADGLRHASCTRGADLQQCDLRSAFLGVRAADDVRLDLSGADLYEADCSSASFRGIDAVSTVFSGRRRGRPRLRPARSAYDEMAGRHPRGDRGSRVLDIPVDAGRSGHGRGHWPTCPRGRRPVGA